MGPKSDLPRSKISDLSLNQTDLNRSVRNKGGETPRLFL